LLAFWIFTGTPNAYACIPVTICLACLATMLIFF
jgi:hypothetical protein